MELSNPAGKWFALFMMLAAYFGYTEDEIVAVVMDVMKLPRQEQIAAYKRGIMALLTPQAQP